MNWKWGSVRNDMNRIKNANKAEIERDTFKLNEPYAVFHGSDGDIYHTTLEVCDCPGKSRWHTDRACSHMIRLAMEVGILDNQGRLESEQLFDDMSFEEQFLAIYSWHYYARHVKLIPDKEYDELKQQWAELLSDNEISRNDHKSNQGDNNESKMVKMNATVDRKIGDGRFQIVTELGILSTSNGGWNKEVNLISWNGEAPKIDIRSWSPDRQKMSRGITLSEEEADKLFLVLTDLRQRN